MLTHEELATMTPMQLGETFSALATRFYGTERSNASCARDMLTARQTVFRWTKGEGNPVIPILLLQEWVARKEQHGDLYTAAQKATETVTQLGALFSTLGEDLNRLSQEARGSASSVRSRGA